jgi:hypothetical protein
MIKALLCGLAIFGWPLGSAAVADDAGPLSQILAERSRLDQAEKHLAEQLAVQSKADAAAGRALPDGAPVHGQISVTTSRGETDKLAGIAVDLYSEKTLRAWLGGVNALAPRELKNLGALAQANGIPTARYAMNLAAWNSISKYEKFAPSPVREAVTDGEGRFRISVPAGPGLYYLVAQSTNETEDRLELYLWIIKAVPGETLWFNNANMASDAIDLSNT